MFYYPTFICARRTDKPDQLDYEDEPSDDEDESQAASDDAGEDKDSDDDHFEDALEHLTIADEQPRAIAVAA